MMVYNYTRIFSYHRNMAHNFVVDQAIVMFSLQSVLFVVTIFSW